MSSTTDFDVYFVNPTADEILGHKVYPSLDALPLTVDMVDVFRKNEDLPGVAEEVVARRREDDVGAARPVQSTRPHRSRTTPGSTSS